MPPASRSARSSPCAWRSPDSDESTVRPVTVTGIGIFPREAVADETALGRHRGGEAERSTRRTRSYRLYSNSRVWLDDPRDFPALARALSAEGMFVSETRAQERHGVEEALGPTVTVLVALGLLASLATVVLVVQVVQRRQDRWRADDAVLTALGAARGARARSIHLASVAAEAVLASRDRDRRDAGSVARGADRSAPRPRSRPRGAPRCRPSRSSGPWRSRRCSPS